MRIIKTSSGKTVVYRYDNQGRVLSETDATGSIRAEYIYLYDKLVAKVEGTGSVYYYHVDPAGTPRVMTDSTGHPVWRAEYRPFGEEQGLQEGVPNDIRFVGKEKDEETGLHYFGARYLEPKIGRFISPDPLQEVACRLVYVTLHSLSRCVRRTHPTVLLTPNFHFWGLMFSRTHLTVTAMGVPGVNTFFTPIWERTETSSVKIMDQEQDRKARNA